MKSEELANHKLHSFSQSSPAAILLDRIPASHSCRQSASLPPSHERARGQAGGASGDPRSTRKDKH